MVKFCIQSDEVRMSGEIGITAKFQIITRAKLDAIRKSSPVTDQFSAEESEGGQNELFKVLQEIVNATVQKKKMKFRILFLLLMVQDWFKPPFQLTFTPYFNNNRRMLVKFQKTPSEPFLLWS